MSTIKPTKRMLINATQKEELRVAVTEGKEVCNLDREIMDSDQKKGPKKGDIILAKVARIEPSLEAAFLDCDFLRHAFLPLKEVNIDSKMESQGHKGRPHIRDVLKQGQKIIVQVEKEERGNKGAFLTSFISLAGPYLVLMPNKSKAGGISRRVEGGERDELKNAIHELSVPEGMSVIIRTAGVGRSADELQWDLDVLLTQWRAIEEAAKNQQDAPYLIYQESDVIIRALRDNLRPDISEILIDTPEAFEHARNHIAQMRPDFVDRIKLYTGSIPLFSYYEIEHQIEQTHSRKVKLANGAEIVFDITEALATVDVNSSKATEGSNIEETAFNTNLAAAKEIARQLRLRDLGGLIVIDFIDMSSVKNQRAVEDKLREELKIDRARTRMRPLSTFGLLEMSRQRLRPSLGDSTQINCPRCEGQGTIRTVPSLALALLRVIEEEGLKENVGQLRIQVPVDVATFLFNEKREALIALENRHNLAIVLLPNPDLLTPHYEITRVRKEETGSKKGEPSYQLIKKMFKQEDNLPINRKVSNDQPAIRNLTQASAPSSSTATSSSSIIRRIWSAIFGPTETAMPPPALDNQPIRSSSTQSEHSGRTSGAARRGRRTEGHNPQRTREPREAREQREPREREPREQRESREPRRQPPAKNSRRPMGNRGPAHQHQPKPHESTHSVSVEEVISSMEITSVAVSQPPILAPIPEQKPAQSKPRRPTRPLRQSATHPDNINKNKVTGNASATTPTPTPIAVAVPVAAALPIPKESSPEQKARKNKTGFTKLSEKEVEANFVIASDQTIPLEKTSESLKQVQSKQKSADLPQSVQKPIVILEEFIKNDFEEEKK